jgi:hypothetical protein
MAYARAILQEKERRAVARAGLAAPAAKTVEALPPAKEGTWGIYVYFAADVPNPDMQDAAWKTLNTLASVGSNEKVKIAAMIDLPGRDTEYFIFPPKPEDMEEWTILPDRFRSNVNSASVDTILDFLDWSRQNCPADNTALVFWGHGYALDDYDPRVQGLKAHFHKPSSDLGRSADGFPGESGTELKLLYDTSYNSVLNNRDFAQAIRDYTQKFNGRKPIQVLGLDCCNMAMAEVLSELQDVTEYMVAAETSLPFASWLTKTGLEMFLRHDDRTAQRFAIDAVQYSVDWMAKSSPSLYIELAACDMKRFPDLERAVGELVDRLLPAIEKYENRRAIAQAWECNVSYVADGLIDLASFCDRLQLAIGDTTSLEEAVCRAAREVIAVVKGTENTRGVVDCVKYAPYHPDENIALSTGLTIWFPPWIQFPNVSYAQKRQSMHYLFHGYSSTHFATVTGWDRFLRKLYDFTQRKSRRSGD